MRIELTRDEALVLHEVLSGWLADSSSEIRHTDSPTVRSGLRSRREVVRRVRELLADAEAEQAS